MERRGKRGRKDEGMRIRGSVVYDYRRCYIFFFFLGEGSERKREVERGVAERNGEKEEQETPAIFQIFSLHLEVRMISLSLTPLILP